MQNYEIDKYINNPELVNKNYVFFNVIWKYSEIH